jgi:uncharacterized Zn-binding protein involved in type VI secretion
MAEPDGHLHQNGQVKTGIGTVLVNGSAAAVFTSQCGCWYAPAGNMIATGHPRVFIGGLFAAREWDYTSHGGHVRTATASPNVFYGTKTDADRIEMAIDRIRHSKFGQTEEGKKVVAKLEELQAQDKIHYADAHEATQMDMHAERGEYNPQTDQITLNPQGPDDKDDVDATARDLTHEGTHAVDGDKPNYVDTETKCWSNETELYKEQNPGYPGPSDEHDRFLAAPDKEGYIEQKYKEDGNPLERRPPPSGLSDRSWQR